MPDDQDTRIRTAFRLLRWSWVGGSIILGVILVGTQRVSSLLGIPVVAAFGFIFFLLQERMALRLTGRAVGVALQFGALAGTVGLLWLIVDAD
jgi:hypothetical protein